MSVFLTVIKKAFSAVFCKYADFCRKHNFNPIIVAAVVVLIAALLVLLFAGIGSGKSSSEPVPGKTTKVEFKDIGELATQAVYYTNVQTIRNAQELWGWKIPLTQTECVFSLDGIIRVGYDFGEIEVEANEETKVITVKMPPAKILGNEIDPESMKIYDEDKNIFTPLSIEDFGIRLEQVQMESEEDAISRGLYENARTNAEVLIRGFLSGVYDMNIYTVDFVHEEQE